jgi:hypothetical protein
LRAGKALNVNAFNLLEWEALETAYHAAGRDLDARRAATARQEASERPAPPPPPSARPRRRPPLPFGGSGLW